VCLSRAALGLIAGLLCALDVCMGLVGVTGTPKNYTLGVLVPIDQGAAGVFPPFQKIGAAILMAIRHVNTRDGQVVGDKTVAALPQDFALRFKIADTRYDAATAVNELMGWMFDVEEKGSCHARVTSVSKESNATIRMPTLHEYEAAASSTGLDAIIGGFNSEVSMATSTLCSLKSLPSVSFASTVPVLSNKERFPGFSRTAPSSASAALAMVYIMQAFGWRRIAVLHVDSEWGQTIALAISRSAAEKGIDILAMGAFESGVPASIDTATLKLRDSGARIFLFVDVQTSFNLGYVLESAEKQGIGFRSKYAWVAWEENVDPEAALAKGAAKTGVDVKTLRKNLQGWLNIGVHSDPTARQKLATAFETTPPKSLYHHVICPFEDQVSEEARRAHVVAPLPGIL